MYVYNLDTGNHHPPPPPTTIITTTTTAKKSKSITHSLGSLLQRSKSGKTHRQTTQQVVNLLDGGRSSVPATPDCRNSAPWVEIEKGRTTISVVGERRKVGLGMEEAAAVVEGRRSAENRAEMVVVSVGVVAELVQATVVAADMSAFMQVHAFRCVRQSLDGVDKFSPKQVAFNVKKDFDNVYGPAWHCIVGSNFGSFVTHATGCFLYFSMENYIF